MRFSSAKGIAVAFAGAGVAIIGSYYGLQFLWAPGSKVSEQKNHQAAVTTDVAKGEKPKPKSEDSDFKSEDADASGESSDDKSSPVAGAVKSEGVALGAATETCSATEFAGEGPNATATTPQDWSKVMATFHHSKKLLVKWIRSKKSQFSREQIDFMVDQVSSLRIQRAPTLEEPDLTYRGIATYSIDDEKQPLIRVGGGFVKFFLVHQKQAEFELTRLLAQSISICDFEVEKLKSPWGPVAECMGLGSNELTCSANATHEGRWALASAIALQVSRPGCDIPAVKDAKVAQCIEHFALPVPEAHVKEAMR